MIDAADLAELRQRFVPCSLEDARRERAQIPTAAALLDAWFAAWAAPAGWYLAGLRQLHTDARGQLRAAGPDRGCTGRVRL